MTSYHRLLLNITQRDINCQHEDIPWKDYGSLIVWLDHTHNTDINLPYPLCYQNTAHARQLAFKFVCSLRRVRCMVVKPFNCHTCGPRSEKLSPVFNLNFCVLHMICKTGITPGDLNVNPSSFKVGKSS